jgi:hypothetical protein
MSNLFSCITDSVSLLWNVPLSVSRAAPHSDCPGSNASPQVFEGDSQANAAGVYRRVHIANSSGSTSQLQHAGDNTIAPILMPRMLSAAAPAVPELTIRCAPGPARVRSSGRSRSGARALAHGRASGR